MNLRCAINPTYGDVGDVGDTLYSQQRTLSPTEISELGTVGTHEKKHDPRPHVPIHRVPDGDALNGKENKVVPTVPNVPTSTEETAA